MEIVFTELLLDLWKDEISNKNKRKSLGQVIICWESPKVFEPPLISSNSLKDYVRETKITGTPAENMDVYIFSCASLLERPFVFTHRRIRKFQFWADYQRSFVLIDRNKEAI